MLTNKQEIFVQEIVKGRSQREAYKIAYGAGKMTDKTIDEKACKLLAQDKIRTRYEEILGKVRNKAERAAVMTAVEVLEELTHIARGDKGYPDYDTFGKEYMRKPGVTSRQKALEALAKHHQLLTDRVALEGRPEIIVRDDIV